MEIDPSEIHADCRRIEGRLQTLLEATRRLSESIGYDDTCANVVAFVASRFASYALLDMTEGEGRIARVAVAHSVAERTPLVEAIRRYHPRSELVSTHPVARAIVRGEVTLETIDDRWIEHAAIDAGHARTMHALEMRELLVVPVVAPSGAVIGALTCGLDAHATRPHFDAGDVAFAEELGRRAGLAIGHARLYEHEHRIAVALQDASLPRVLPRIEGLRLDAHYRPGRDEATIGGDWYDAFELEGGRVALTIGDVVGSGLEAAVTMTKLRQAMQAAAMLRAEPAAMLEVADRTLRLHAPGGYATALAAIYDERDATLTFATAGHPLPLRLDARGVVDVCRARGLMLGVELGAVREPVVIAAPPGTSFVFYTDGLTEIARDIDAGERALHAAVSRGDVMRLPRPARSIVDALLRDAQHTDDVALLTVAVVAMPALLRGRTARPA